MRHLTSTIIRAVLSLAIIGIFCSRLSSQVLYACYSPSGDTLTYLMGTCHILPKKAFQFDPKIDSIIGNADVVFSELYNPKLDPTYNEYTKRLRDVTFIPDNKTIEDLLSKEEIKQLYAYYKENHGVSDKQIRAARRYKPTTFDQRLTTGKDSSVFMDHLLFESATKQKKKLLLLDDAFTILNARLAIGRIYDARWLYESIIGDTSMRHVDLLTENAYLAKDTAAMKKLLSNDPRRHYPDHDFVIRNRNDRWEALISSHGGKVNFVFSGIAHIIEDNEGLISRLIKKGYRVEAVDIHVSQKQTQ